MQHFTKELDRSSRKALSHPALPTAHAKRTSVESELTTAYAESVFYGGQMPKAG
jgi:hypothetical protein